MMLATVFTKALRDRWLAMTVGTTALAAMLVWGMSVYSDIDLSFLDDMPEAMRGLMNLPAGSDASGFAYGAIYGMMGAITLAALAISIGTGAIAGEERKGTMSLLLGNPRSRTHIVISKALALVSLAIGGSTILWLGAVAAPEIIGIEITGLFPAALVVHMGVNALFYGFLALFIGCATGDTTKATGVSVGVLVVAYLSASLLPLVNGLEELAKISPWYYFTGSDPVNNGIDVGDLAVLLGLTAVAAVGSVVAMNRRDLAGRSQGVTLLDRLRENRHTQRVTDILAGSTRVSRLSVKAASDAQGTFTLTSLAMVAMGLMIGPLYATMDENLKTLTDDLPDNLLAMVGGVDMSTPAGFVQAETFSIVAPIVFVVLAATVSVRALAGEEANNTMPLLLANPISRRSVVLEKAVTMVVLVSLLGAVTFAANVAGSTLGGLDLPIANLAAISALASLLGMTYGAVGLCAGAATGRTRLSGYTTAGLAILGYFMYSFLPLSDSLAGWAKVSPFHFYLGGDPLATGMDWTHASVLAAMVIVLIGASVALFERRDLQHGN